MRGSGRRAWLVLALVLGGMATCATCDAAYGDAERRDSFASPLAHFGYSIELDTRRQQTQSSVPAGGAGTTAFAVSDDPVEITIQRNSKSDSPSTDLSTHLTESVAGSPDSADQDSDSGKTHLQKMVPVAFATAASYYGLRSISKDGWFGSKKDHPGEVDVIPEAPSVAGAISVLSAGVLALRRPKALRSRSSK